MRILTWIAFLGALNIVAGANAAKQSAIDLRQGEVVTLTIDDGGRVVEVKRGLAPPMNALETAALRELTAGKYDWAAGARAAPVSAGDLGVPQPENPDPGLVTVKLFRVGDASILFLRNGYDRAFRYRATIIGKGKDSPTDVCEVLPGRYGMEHWANGFDAIRLSTIRLEPWSGTRAPICE